MIIRRIEVSNFRRLVEPVVIEGLSSGLTLIAGDNEEGKSTLVECIRTAFFVKHNITGEFAAAMQPYHSSVRPEVRIEFELDGQHYRLFKAYCLRPEAELVTPNGTLSGSAAEEELSRLLSFSLPKRIRKDDQREHEGVFGMFWVEQGKSLTLEPNAAGRASIAEALKQEVGDVLGGKRGQRLIAEVRRQREELLTSTGKSRGAYAIATQAIHDLEAELAVIEEQFANHTRSADEFERCRRRLDQFQREGTLEAARERLQSAQRASEKVAGLESAAHDADVALQAAKARHEFASERAAQRARLVEALGLAEAALDELVRSIETERARVSVARRKLETDEQVLAEAQEQLESVERELNQAEAADRLASMSARLVRLQHDHSAALAASREREAALAIAAGVRVEKKGLAQLRRLQEAVTSARARLEALATQIEISVALGAEVLINEQTIVGEQRRTLTRATVIDAPGCMRLSIFPGSEAGNPQAELEVATRDFNEVLQRLGSTSLADAEDQFERRAAALSRADASAKLLGAHAPQGMEELSAQIAATAVEVQVLEPLVDAGPSTETTDLPGKLNILRRRHQQSKDAVEAARSQVEHTRSELSKAINGETAATAKHSHQQALCTQYRERLDSERASVPDEELGAKLLQAMQEVKAAEIALAAAHRALDEAKPEAVAQEQRMAGAAYQQLESDIASLREKAIRLEAELRVSGGLGLGERSDELQARLGAAHLEAARIEGRAKTLDLLLRVLVDAETAAKEQFLRPVTERVQAYLKILLPGTELAFNEDINIVGLRRGATVEPFQTLSVGTREQLAVLTRLAFADLLREHGHPAAVLLDDAIVFADDERFERMLRILDKAAQNVQVVVLTCRERDYRVSGAPVIRLTDCKVQNARSELKNGGFAMQENGLRTSKAGG
jgi:chromosome segregation ATPase